MKILYLQCNMGASGDMLLGALYDLLSDREKQTFLDTMKNLDIPGLSLTPVSVQKCGISATKMQVRFFGTEEETADAQAHHTCPGIHSPHINPEIHSPHTDPQAHSYHSYSEILNRISRLALPEKVREHVLAVYSLIGEAESAVHGTTLEQIHFHELGSLDALADVVGCCLLLHLLNPDEIYGSPVHVGSGTVTCAHGILPVPTPATERLLRGIPIYSKDVPGELCTPTGAALLRHFVTKFCDMPVMTLSGTGYGAGTKDFPTANLLRAYLGETVENPGDILSLSCNLDDMTGEDLSFACSLLLKAGALDVYTTPIFMKKGRPGYLLTCLCHPAEEEKFATLILKHTTTRGLRITRHSRYVMKEEFYEKTLSSLSSDPSIAPSTSAPTLRMKKSSGYGLTKEKPEYEDLEKLALEYHLTLAQLRALLSKME